MLAGVDGDRESDYNGSEDVAHRIDGTNDIQGVGKRYTIKSELLTDAVRFWVANPDYNYGYLFVLQETTALLPNCPNLFNPETWIPYHLSEAAHLTLTIYHMRGVAVRQLILGYQPAGIYQSHILPQID